MTGNISDMESRDFVTSLIQYNDNLDSVSDKNIKEFEVEISFDGFYRESQDDPTAKKGWSKLKDAALAMGEKIQNALAAKGYEIVTEIHPERKAEKPDFVSFAFKNTSDNEIVHVKADFEAAYYETRQLMRDQRDGNRTARAEKLAAAMVSKLGEKGIVVPVDVAVEVSKGLYDNLRQMVKNDRQK